MTGATVRTTLCVSPQCPPLSFSVQLEPFMISFLTGPRVSPAEPARVAAPDQTSPKDTSPSVVAPAFAW